VADGKFAGRDYTFGLVTNVEKDLFAVNLNNNSGN